MTATNATATGDRAIATGASRPDAFLPPFSRPAAIAVLLALIAVVVVVFRQWPELDQAAASWFFSQLDCPAGRAAGAVCGAFTAGDVRALALLRQFFQITPLAVAIGLLVWGAVRFWRLRDLTDALTLRLTVLFWSYVIGVGIVVNAFFKMVWGRPRPHMVDVFGGSMPFVPAGDWTGLCERNCSFISGESAAAFWMVCVVALLPPAYRPVGYLVTLLFAVATAWLRVVFGGHFLSDVALGGLAAMLIVSLLANAARRYAR